MRISMAILGLTGVIGPFLLIRELMAASGGDARGAVAVLAASWGWMAVGAWLAEYRGRGVPFGRETIGTWSHPYGGTLVLVALFLPLQITLARAMPRDWFWGWGGIGLAMLLSAPLSLMLGAQYALGRRLLEIQQKIAGRAFFYQALGAAAGGLLFAGLLVPLFNAMQIALTAVVLNLAAGWWMGSSAGLNLAEGVAGPVYAYLLMLVAMIISVLVLPVGTTIEETTLSRQWPGLIAAQDSSRGRMAAVYDVLGDRVYWANAALFDAPDTSDSLHDDEGSEYQTVRWALTAHPDARRLLLLGGGPEGLRAALAGTLEVIHYAEPDEQLAGFWSETLPAQMTYSLRDARVTPIRAEARSHLQNAPCCFDLLVVNLPGPVSESLNRYYTLEFWASARRVLAADGLLVVRLFAGQAADASHTTCLAGVRAALEQQFPSLQEFREGLPEGQWLLLGRLDGEPGAKGQPSQPVNRDLTPTCPANVARPARQTTDNLVAWAMSYGWQIGPVGLLFLVGWLRRDLRVPLLPAFAALASGAALACALVGLQRGWGLLYAGAADLLVTCMAGVAVAGGIVLLLLNSLKPRALLALMVASLLTASLLVAVEPGLLGRLAGETTSLWAVVGLMAVAGLPVGVTLAVSGSQGRPGAAFVAASAGQATGAALTGLLLIPSAGPTVAGQIVAVLTLLGLLWLVRLE